jgi:Holliday junction resolvase RusA-like endonuclease
MQNGTRPAKSQTGSREAPEGSESMSEHIQFFVPGIPRPGGSKKGFYNKRLGRVMMVEAGKHTANWRASVSQAGSEAVTELLTGPLRVRFDFVFTRPKSHYGSGKNSTTLKAGAPPYPASKPDCLKCGRSTEDALTGILWRDDAQIVTEALTKRYGEQAGCLIRVAPEKA